MALTLVPPVPQEDTDGKIVFLVTGAGLEFPDMDHQPRIEFWDMGSGDEGPGSDGKEFSHGVLSLNAKDLTIAHLLRSYQASWPKWHFELGSWAMRLLPQYTAKLAALEEHYRDQEITVIVMVASQEGDPDDPEGFEPETASFPICFQFRDRFYFYLSVNDEEPWDWAEWHEITVDGKSAGGIHQADGTFRIGRHE